VGLAQMVYISQAHEHARIGNLWKTRCGAKIEGVKVKKSASFIEKSASSTNSYKKAATQPPQKTENRMGA